MKFIQFSKQSNRDDDVRRDDDDDDDDARGAAVHNAGFGWYGDGARGARRRETVGDDARFLYAALAIRTQSDDDDDDDSGNVFAGTTAFAAFDVF